MRETWQFDDQLTGAQRLTLEFNQAGQLVSVLWIPQIGESESQLKNVLVRYPNIAFKPIETREKVHSAETETIYSDEASMSIWHNDEKKKVEAIAWFITDQRVVPPQTNKK